MATATWIETMMEKRGVDCDELQDRVAIRAQKTPQGGTVGIDVLAKVVVVLADGRPTALIVPSSRRVVLERVGKLLGADVVSIIPENEIESALTSRRPARAAFARGHHSITMLMDATLVNAGALVLQAGTAGGGIRLTLGDWLQLANPGVGYFTEPDQDSSLAYS
jgi:prolyl-tRNA editing enzyme YbaK/EbsC (Cys-tRNA(Pro) deacylase)